MRIDIITFHNTSNFGATLQCCAMSYYLSKIGHRVTIINYLPHFVMKKKSILKEFHKKRGLLQTIKSTVRGIAYAAHAIELIGKDKKFEKFINENMLLTRPYYSESEVLQDPPTADLYICGSDQIWNPALTGGRLDRIFFLQFTEAKRASYGASLGELNVDENSDELKRFTEKYEAISVREKSSSKKLSVILGRQVEVVLDCTLLLDKEDYSIMESKSFEVDGPYLLLYDIHYSANAVSIAKKEAEKRNLKIFDISPNPLKRVNGAVHLINIGPAEFLKLFKGTEFVVTNSFHGTVFSIIYERQFITVPHNLRSARMNDLLEDLNLKDRIAYGHEYIEHNNIDYEIVKNRLNELRKHSFDYINSLI